MTQTEALRLALEALENNRRTHHYCEDTWYSCPKHEDGCANDSEGDECNCGADKANAGIDQAITAVQAALEAKDEPVSTGDTLFRQFMSEAEKAGVTHLTPPQRKPLTDEEILTYRYMIDWTAEWSYINFARAIEAAHGIK